MSEGKAARARGTYSLTEKISIVRESMAPGVSASFVARRHHIAVNVLYYWRKAFGELLESDLARIEAGAETDRQLQDLRLQVRNLERLLGQRTLEIALLREKLGTANDDDGGG